MGISIIPTSTSSPAPSRGPSMQSGLMPQSAKAGNSYEDAQRKMRMAEALLGQAFGQRSRSIGDGLSKIANILVADTMSKRGQRAMDEVTASSDAVWQSLMGGGSSGGYSGASVPMGDMRQESQVIADDAMTAIGQQPRGWNYQVPQEFVQNLVGMESGGNFGAVGPETKYGRALGFAQVLPENVVKWSREILGREVSPQEFLASPELQKQIVFGKLDQYWQQTGGNPRDVAALWHSGLPYDQAVSAGRRDVNMTTKDYADRIAGGTSSGQPTLQQITAAMSDPVIQRDPGKMAVLNALLGQAMAPPQQRYRQVSGAQLGMTGDDANAQFNVSPDGRVTRIGGGGVTVQNNLGENTSELDKKLDAQEADIWGSYLTTGTQSAGMMQDMEALMQLVQMAPQGPIQGRLAERFTGFSSAGAAFNAIVKRVAPTMRAEGSGSTSDIEYDGMLKSLPQLSNKPEANAAIAEMMRAKAQINIDRANIVRQYRNKEISAAQARSAIAEVDSRSIMSPQLQALISQTGEAEKPWWRSIFGGGDEGWSVEAD